MSSANIAAVSSFVEGAPPGELSNVIADIKALTVDEPKLLDSVGPAFKRYNEEQFATVKLPGGSQQVHHPRPHGKEEVQDAERREQVIVSSYNALGDGRYYDVESQSSFEFDHTTQIASAVQSYTLESQNSDLIKSLLKSLSTHAREHYPSSTRGIYPITSDSEIAILLVANKYSPNNFWTGRWRSLYTYNPTTNTLTGHLKVDVHYYEDGNVRLITSKPIPSTSLSSSASATEIVRTIAGIERKYQEELNKAFGNLSEGAFKGLRRQLPVTRQKVEWEKIASYRLGQDISGGRAR